MSRLGTVASRSRLSYCASNANQLWGSKYLKGRRARESIQRAGKVLELAGTATQSYIQHSPVASRWD